MMLRIIKKLFGYCSIHGWFKYPRRYRMNTAYNDNEKNYNVGCTECQKDSYEYYDDLWTTYRSGLL